MNNPGLSKGCGGRCSPWEMPGAVGTGGDLSGIRDAQGCGEGVCTPQHPPFAHPTATEMNSAARDGAALAGAELTCWVISTERGQAGFPPRQRGSRITGRGREGCMVQIKTGTEATLNHYFVTPLLKNTTQQTHKNNSPPHHQPPKILPAALFNLFGSCFP